jgi:hypothetical protein
MRKSEKGIVHLLLVFVFLILISVVVGAYIIGKKTSLSSNSLKNKAKTFLKGTEEIPSESDNFKLVDKITGVPDDYYTNGNFCRFFYFPEKQKYYLTFATGKYSGKETYQYPGYAYKEYSTDLKETGKNGFFHENINRGIIGGDGAMVFAEDHLYLLTGGGPSGWVVEKYDQDFNLVKQTQVNLDRTRELGNDQMLAYINGMLDASSLYALSVSQDNKEPLADNLSVGGPNIGEATHHTFLTPDLEFIEKKILDDELHVNGSSMVYHNGVYNLVTSTAWFGDLIVLQYDKNWQFLGKKKLAEDGRWSMGTVYVDGIFYVAYARMIQKGSTGIVLAAFDENWQPLDSIAVSDFDADTAYLSDRPYITHHNGLLYVAYDIEKQISEGSLKTQWWNCKVNVYKPKLEGASSSRGLPLEVLAKGGD